ncbi:MAG: Xaa-Pro peptidase family protein [Treponema sp.]|jgi:Xaa-Pro dipeptidase|nr:Xaa-Pro peptidase family protein [Treponema sp.]
MPTNVASHYQARLEKIWDWMAREEIALVMFEDTEGRRNASIRWLTGHPGDALLFLSLDRKSLLMPWDIILARAYSRADFIIPYNEFDRSPIKAIRGVAEKLKIPLGSKIEISPDTPYPVFLDFVGELSDFDIICRNTCAAAYALDLRAVKDAEELAILKSTAGITNAIIDLLEKNARSGKIKTEADAALFIELESRKRGAEGASFEILAAGPDRSFGIHAFPSWTNAPFGGQGLSILDFGLRYGGYCTDVTLTFARELSAQQQKMVNLVEKAAKLAVEMAVNGAESQAVAIAIDDFFAKSKKRMPHGLGHGIGLDVHEYPFIRNRSVNGWKLEPGMVFTLEPGLYDPIHGGCRLENDILVTESRNEILTEARIIWL